MQSDPWFKDHKEGNEEKTHFIVNSHERAASKEFCQNMFSLTLTWLSK